MFYQCAAWFSSVLGWFCVQDLCLWKEISSENGARCFDSAEAQTESRQHLLGETQAGPLVG